MFRRGIGFLPCVFFLFAVLFGTEETLASVSEESLESASGHVDSTGSAESTSRHVDSTGSAESTSRSVDSTGSAESMSSHIDSTGSAESTTEVDSSSQEDDAATTTSATYTTTVAPTDDRSHAEEPKLPVDLLSEDILLDPNVVLARLARAASSSEYLYRRPVRRTELDRDYYRDNGLSSRRNYVQRRLPIYPVFPGKK